MTRRKALPHWRARVAQFSNLSRAGPIGFLLLGCSEPQDNGSSPAGTVGCIYTLGKQPGGPPIRCVETQGLSVAQAQGQAQACNYAADGGLFQFRAGSCPRDGAIAACQDGPNSTEWFYANDGMTLDQIKASCHPFWVADSGAAAPETGACPYDGALRPEPPVYFDPTCPEYTFTSPKHGTRGCCRSNGTCGVFFRQEACGGRILLPAECIDPNGDPRFVLTGDARTNEKCTYPGDAGK